MNKKYDNDQTCGPSLGRFVRLVVAVFRLELPHVLVGVLQVVLAELVQDLLQIRSRLPGLLDQVSETAESEMLTRKVLIYNNLSLKHGINLFKQPAFISLTFDSIKLAIKFVLKNKG